MFAGLPGIGVGTLFYVLIGLWMPVYELVRVARGTSSVARWRLIVRQLCFSLSIVTSIVCAERVVMWILGEAAPDAMNPASVVNRTLSTNAPESVLAAPVIASIFLLVAVLLTVEALRLISAARHTRWLRRVEPGRGLRNQALRSSPQ